MERAACSAALVVTCNLLLPRTAAPMTSPAVSRGRAALGASQSLHVTHNSTSPAISGYEPSRRIFEGVSHRVINSHPTSAKLAGPIHSQEKPASR